MATVNQYAYPEALGFGDFMAPGEVRGITFGPWPPFSNAVVTISVHPSRDEFSEKTMKLESISSRQRANGEHFIDCTFSNASSGGIKFWTMYLCVVSP